jgi:hypothetical protein
VVILVGTAAVRQLRYRPRVHPAAPDSPRDITALRDDAVEHHWNTEVARHSRVIATSSTTCNGSHETVAHASSRRRRRSSASAVLLTDHDMFNAVTMIGQYPVSILGQAFRERGGRGSGKLSPQPRWWSVPG